MDLGSPQKRGRPPPIIKDKRGDAMGIKILEPHHYEVKVI